MADMNEEMASLMAAMEETKPGPVNDDIDVLFAEPGEESGVTRGRAEKARADKKREEETSSKILKRVLPIVGAGIGALVLGLVLGAVLFSASGGEEERVVHEIDAVNLKSPILEQLDSVKDAQIRSLEKQLAETASNVNAGRDNETRLAMAAPFSRTSAAANAVNGLLDTAIALSPTASDTEVRIAVDQVNDFMTQSGIANAYKFLTGPSPAKDLNIDCRKASLATVTLSGMSGDGSAFVTVAAVPVMASDSTLYTALYVVLINGDRVESCEYVGVLADTAGTEVNTALENAYVALEAVKGNTTQSSVSIGVGEAAASLESAETEPGSVTSEPEQPADASTVSAGEAEAVVGTAAQNDASTEQA